MICPSCDCKNDNRVACVSCGIFFENYFERQRKVKKDSANASSSNRTFGKMAGPFLGAGMVVSMIAGSLYWTASSKEPVRLAQDNQAKIEKTEIISTAKKVRPKTNNVSSTISLQDDETDIKKIIPAIEELAYKNSDIAIQKETCLEGNCFYGYGVIVVPGVGKYYGEWKNGKRDGQGAFISFNGSKYVGGWKDDRNFGQGTFTDTNGNKYVGEWRNRQRDGFGTLKYADGSRYTGEWHAGLRHGQGTFTRTDGSQYVGEWKNDEINGYGTLTDENGHKFVGMCRNGQPIENVQVL